ncbi:MAG: Nicotinamide-nucleotide amidohydrolase PncC [Chlamydiae bacterium]|nr:Nicotinamide-nucleotide amidohydrolase PncC [Chlamydiota bacterium]
MTLEEKIQSFIVEQGKTLALAESCTGGSLSARLVALPGASDYFLGSLVTYSNALKRELLGVSAETLRVHGPVSRETAHEMLIGLLKRTDTHYGIAVTGVAGPTGGTKEKPVGTVWIAVGCPGVKPRVHEHHFSGERAAIIASTVEAALNDLASFLPVIAT